MTALMRAGLVALVAIFLAEPASAQLFNWFTDDEPKVRQRANTRVVNRTGQAQQKQSAKPKRSTTAWSP